MTSSCRLGGDLIRSNFDLTPQLLSVNYSVAPIGSTIQVSGIGFNSVTAVSIGGTPQATYTVQSSTLIEITVDNSTALTANQEITIENDGKTLGDLYIDVIQLSSSLVTWAHGSVPTITESGYTGNFDGTTTVSIGGVSQTITPSGGSTFTIDGVSDSTPVGTTQTLAVSVGGVSFAPINLATVVHLVLDEVDSDTATDEEFVEISTGGIGSVDLSDYVLVLYNDTSVASYNSFDLGTADANGYFLVGNAAVLPDITIGSLALQNGPDAVGIYQGDAATDFPFGTSPTATNLIDALVYCRAATCTASGMLNTLLGFGPEAVELDESDNGFPDDQSISRCSSARNDGRSFIIANSNATPRAANDCP